jgi:hypothetical protein
MKKFFEKMNFLFCLFFVSVVSSGQMIKSFNEQCKMDAQCRSNSDCSAFCNVSTMTCQRSFIPLVCSVTDVCYEVTGFCFARCIIDSDCRFSPFVTQKPGVCDRETGKCQACLFDSDCVSHGGACIIGNDTQQNMCSNASLVFQKVEMFIVIAIILIVF